MRFVPFDSINVSEEVEMKWRFRSGKIMNSFTRQQKPSPSNQCRISTKRVPCCPKFYDGLQVSGRLLSMEEIPKSVISKVRDSRALYVVFAKEKNRNGFKWKSRKSKKKNDDFCS